MPAIAAASASRRFQSATAAMTMVALLVPPSDPVRAAPAGRKLGAAARAGVRKGHRKRVAGNGNGSDLDDGGGGGSGGGGGVSEVVGVNGTRHEQAADGSPDIAAITDGAVQESDKLGATEATSTTAVTAANETGEGEEEEEEENEQEVGVQQAIITTKHSETALPKGEEAQQQQQQQQQHHHQQQQQQQQQQRRQIFRNEQKDSVARKSDGGVTAASKSASGGGGSGLETHATKDKDIGALDGAGAGAGVGAGAADNGKSEGEGEGGNGMVRSGVVDEGIGGSAQAAAVQVRPLSELRADEGGVAEPEDETGTEAEVVEECRVTGPCLRCERNELLLDYCKETGRREEVRCTEQTGGPNIADVGTAGAVGVLPSSVKYRSCDYVEDDFLGLFHFWVTMVALGALACFFMRRRQKRGGSLYDRRAK